jgi:hypothetical protein
VPFLVSLVAQASQPKAATGMRIPVAVPISTASPVESYAFPRRGIPLTNYALSTPGLDPVVPPPSHLCRPKADGLPLFEVRNYPLVQHPVDLQARQSGESRDFINRPKHLLTAHGGRPLIGVAVRTSMKAKVKQKPRDEQIVRKHCRQNPAFLRRSFHV